MANKTPAPFSLKGKVKMGPGVKVIRQTSQRGSQASKSLLRDSRQAPMTPAWSFSFDNTISESRLIRLSVYFRTAR